MRITHDTDLNSILWFTMLACAASLILPLQGSAEDRYREAFRPQFHFTPERNWMNDPNGMVFFEGEYHLFYQHNPFGDKWGHMSWGHAVSHDLAHWEHLPLALAEEGGVMIFSGSAVVDWGNTSGFGKDGKPPLVAIYTGHYTTKPLQNQNIAYSTDRGRTWVKYAGNPVLDLKMADFRDPKVFWDEARSRWLMTVALPAEKKVHFYASPDLKEWKYVGEFGPSGATGGLWECPDLFPAVVEGGGTKWVLIVNVNPGGPAGGSGCQYFVGEFDGNRFIADTRGSSTPPALWADRGRDFYAAVSWGDIPKGDGRRLWLGWMSNWDYANDVPTAPWRSAMTIPRELGLRKTGDGMRLVQKPVHEFAALRGEHYHFNGGTVPEVNEWVQKNKLQSESVELSVEFAPSRAENQGVRLFRGVSEETVVGIDRDHGRVYVDRTRSGNVGFHPKFPGKNVAPLARPNDRVRLEIFVDACSIEVFVNDGEAVLSNLVFPSRDSRGVEFFGPVDGTLISSVDVWPLSSAWRK